MVDLLPLGAEVRRLRQARGLTLRELALAAGLSERFLSDLERGVGNIAIARLFAVAEALEVPIAALVAPLDKLRDDTKKKAIALVGLRGAGKSTIGPLLAAKLGHRFVELDRAVEARAGLPLGQIFEIHGEGYYRRLERESLLEALDHGPRARGVVIATGGGVVTDPDSWSLLQKKTRTVWLKARPEEHYARVMAQGDSRPMKNRPAAMLELRALLASREPRYAESDLTVDTGALGLEGAVDRVADWLA